jgi:hypothetical protein
MRTTRASLLSIALPLFSALVAASACGDSGSNESLIDAGTSAGGSNSGGSSSGGSSTGGSLVGFGGMNDGDGGELNCGETNLAASPQQVNVLLVVDRSASMAIEPEGFGTTRWAALVAGLNAAVEAAEGSVAFGLTFFPFTGTSGEALQDACQAPAGSDVLVPIEAGTTAAPKIASALDDNAPPSAGSTPTAAALAHALEYFTSGAGADLEGQRYVLLATDGGPNCNAAGFPDGCAADQCTVNIDQVCPVTNCCSSAALGSECLDQSGAVAAVEALRDAQVRTFVVGIPGTENYEPTLNALAVAGGAARAGTPKYYAVSATGGVSGLTGVLTQITTGLITSCRLELDANPSSEFLVNVKIDGEKVLKGPDGWDIDKDTDPWTIVLLGDTCDRVGAEGAENVEITFGCPTVQ